LSDGVSDSGMAKFVQEWRVLMDGNNIDMLVGNFAGGPMKSWSLTIISNQRNTQ
jgi:hypothetical protein